MINWLLRLFPLAKSFFGNRLLLLAVTTAFTAGSSLGWYVTSKVADADLKDMYEAQLEEKKQAILRTVSQYEQLIADNNDVTTDYVYSVTDINKADVTITKELDSHESNPDCDVPVVIERMLNYARTGDTTMSTSSRGAPTESGTPGSITARDEYQAHKECGLAFRKLKARNDLLVDWINKQYPK